MIGRAAFAVESIRRWWYKLGQTRYANASRLVITADCGGSNGPRVKLWKRELQRFANERCATALLRPPPGRRTRLPMSLLPDRSSRMPRLIVLRARLVAFAVAVTPP